MSLAPLHAFRQFILVLLAPRDNGKTDKLPCRADGTVCDAHDPSVWMSYDEAAALATSAGGAYGVGFVLTDRDPFFCIDIDGAATPSGWSPVAQQLCAALPGTAVEVSQSGRGLHIWGRRASPPAHSSKNIALHLECYTRARFILLGTDAVGAMAEDCPAFDAVVAGYFPPRNAGGDIPDSGPRTDWRGPADDADLIRRALRSQSAGAVFGGRASFAALWDADEAALARAYPSSTGDVYDRSSADAALAQHLAFWTGCDGARIERLMRGSKLVRDKWDREDYLPRTITNACGWQREVLVDKPVAAAPAAAGVALAHVHDNAPTIANVKAVIAGSPDVVQIAFDEFLGRTLIARNGGDWQPFVDTDYGRLRERFDLLGFKPVSHDVVMNACRILADDHRIDTARDWVSRLKWDGVPRIEASLISYFGAEDSPYSRAVGAYIFTALAGRALEPGVQADMAPVFVGLQGKRKTSIILALVPKSDFFVEVHLKDIHDKDQCRLIRGKLVAEISELRGLTTTDRESIKAWITRRIERWVEKYREHDTTYARRVILFGTTNETEFLDDPTGERRWLPVEVGDTDPKALARDREQLWAEGAQRFRSSGIAWQDAERLARAEHAKFKHVDAWAEPVAQYLGEIDPATGHARGSREFKLQGVLVGALGRPLHVATRADQRRLADVLRSLGYGKTRDRTGRSWALCDPCNH